MNTTQFLPSPSPVTVTVTVTVHAAPPREPADAFEYLLRARADQRWSAVAGGHAILNEHGVALKFITPTHEASADDLLAQAVAIFPRWMECEPVDDQLAAVGVVLERIEPCERGDQMNGPRVRVPARQPGQHAAVPKHSRHFK